MATAGWIMGIIGTVIIVLGILLLIVLASRWLEQRLGGAPRQAAAGRTRSAAAVQIISSRPGPTPIITIGMPRNSEMKSR